MLGRDKRKTYRRRFGFWLPVREPKVEDIETTFPPCPVCECPVWVAKSRAEAINLHLDLFIRQYFDCANCGVRARLARQVRSGDWTFFNAPRYF